MSKRTFILIGIALVLQGLSHDWSNWRSVLYGVAIGVYIAGWEEIFYEDN
ncbi:hypothetical protein [Phascolarctobacterium sp.]